MSRATVHERVACPKCKAPVGERCAAMRGYGGGGYGFVQLNNLPPIPVRLGEPTKHPHKERLKVSENADVLERLR